MSDDKKYHSKSEMRRIEAQVSDTSKPSGADRLANFLAGKSISPFVSNELAAAREWWINDNAEGDGTLSAHRTTWFGYIHVIEHSAYLAVCKELVEAKGECHHLKYDNERIKLFNDQILKEHGHFLKIPDYDDYMVSREGLVLSFKSGKLLKPFLWGDASKRNGKYPAVMLWREGRSKAKKLSHIVLESFVGPRNGKVAAHLDGNKNNNHLNNLKWVSPSENEQHKKLHGTCPVGENTNCVKLTEKQIIEIREKHARGATTTRLADEYSVSHQNVNHIVRRLTWKHI